MTKLHGCTNKRRNIEAGFNDTDFSINEKNQELTKDGV